MSIIKVVGVVVAGIPIVGILIGGITFGVTFKTDVANIKEDVAEQQTVNVSVEERFNELDIPAPYNDSLLWLQADNINERIDSIHIPEVYDDSYLDERIQNIALNVIELRTELDNLEIKDVESFDDSDLRGRLAELEGQLNALASIDMTSDGSIDIGPLVVRLATAEGTLSALKSSVDSIKGDIRTIKSDVTSVERTANAAKNTADSAKSSSGGSRTIENNYDDSNLRSRISAVERQVNALPTTSSSGTTVQRVENPFNDASLRADISSLQTAVAVLQATGATSYDDSDLRDMIDDIQWELDNLDIPTSTGTVDVSWLEDLIYNIKEELSWRIDELEWASDTTTTSDDMYAEKWLVEDLRDKVIYVQDQVWELQTLINDLQTSINNSTTSSSSSTTSGSTTTTISGRSWEGAWDEPYLIYVDHQQDSYTGDYWMDGYWNGEPVWVNWECGNPGSQFEYCYVFKYNYASWVIQPLEPSNEWLANAYTDGQWPWSGTWNGDVNSVENKS